MSANLRTKTNLIEFDFYVSPDGEEYNFNNAADKFVLGSSGRGMPPINYLGERGPFQHGMTLLDYRLSPRTIQVIHRVSGDNRADYWVSRAALINSLRPNRQSANDLSLGYLSKILEDRTERRIDVLVEAGPQFNLKDPKTWDEWGFTEVLRFFAPDPTFYAPTVQESTFSLSSVTDLVFPITFPIQFATGALNDNNTIVYNGTWLEYPIIVLTGPLDQPVITNSTTSEVIDFNYNISAGEIVTMNLRYGAKTIVNDSGTNLIGSLSTDSDFGTFHIAPDPEAANGNNVINLVASGADENSSVVVQYLERYIGI